MAQIVVRNIPDPLFDRFKKRAKLEGKSAEQLAREAIALAANIEPEPYWTKKPGKVREPPQNTTDANSSTKPSRSPAKKKSPGRPVANDWQKDSLW